MLNHEHCQAMLDDLSIYLDGEASDALCAEIELHLETCDNCRVVIDTLRRTVSLYQMLPQPELPQALREKLYKTLDLEQFLPRQAD